MVTLGVLPRNRYEVIYNSVDLPRVQPDVARGQAFRRRYSIPDDRKLVLQVSWMIPEKGVADLLKAAETVVRRDPTVHFALVGEGELREHYEQEAAAMGLREHVTWTGLIKNPFEEGVYDAADILCQMSRWEEAFGWVIAEAMAFGKPVVATRVGGIPEVVADGETGFLVSRGATSEMADRILKLIEDPQLRTSMGHCGKTQVSPKFDLRTNVARLIELYGIDSKVKIGNTGAETKRSPTFAA